MKQHNFGPTHTLIDTTAAAAWKVKTRPLSAIVVLRSRPRKAENKIIQTHLLVSVLGGKSRGILHNQAHSWSRRGGRGAHDMPAADGLARSAERHSMPHCSSLLATCFFSSSPPRRLIRAGQNQNPPRRPPNACQNSSISRLPPPAVNCRRVAPTVPKTPKSLLCDFSHALYCFKQSSG